VLANPFKTRIIAEAQIKTDKVDARILADLLRGRLVSSVHIAGRETRQIKEVLCQRCFFVRQRTMLRNRIHRLPGGQHELKLPQCSDLFGRKGVGFLERLKAPARLLFTQQLTLLKELAVRIRCNENKIPVKPRITVYAFSRTERRKSGPFRGSTRLGGLRSLRPQS
jgi:transposase